VEWRRLHIEEIHSLYHSSDIIRRIQSRKLRCAVHVARMKKGRNAFKMLTVKPTGNRPLEKYDYIRMDLKEIGINTRNWVDSAQDMYYWRAFENADLNLRVP
jgi:hypothetical protein